MQLIFTMRDALKTRPCLSRRDGQRLGIHALSSHMEVDNIKGILEIDNIKGILEVAYICYEQLCYCSQICCPNRASFSSSFEAVNKVIYRSINLFSSRCQTSRSPSRPSVSVVSSMRWKIVDISPYYLYLQFLSKSIYPSVKGNCIISYNLHTLPRAPKGSYPYIVVVD